MYPNYLLLLFLFASIPPLTAQVTVEKQAADWQLIVDGNPFDIKGVTFGYVNEADNYDQYFQDLQYLGVNTIRLWATNENTPQLLDAAHAHGMKILMGIWMRHGRPGMEDDDSFNYLEDKQGMEDMYNSALQIVEAYKDHPAVLCWAIGNEVYLNMATDPEKEAYSKLLERICSSIKAIDDQHPISSVEAWTFGLDWWQKYVPSLDIYGLNSYGPGVHFLAAELEKKNIDMPYMITEFGVTGEWDIQAEKHGIKQEPNDQEKYDAIANGYHEWINNKPACLGVYVFHYADKNSFVSPWLLTHHNGSYRPQYWAIREAFTGQKPENNVPLIETFELKDEKITSGSWVPVKLVASDAEQEVLTVSFYYNQRTGSRKRRNQILPLIARGNLTDGFEIQVPKEDGAIKVYVNVQDTYNNVGIASTALLASDAEAATIKYQVPRVSLPFYVYQDGGDLPYYASGYMGNYEVMSVDLNNTEEVYAGETAIKIHYGAMGNWYGLAFVDPANDWGDILGGYNISEAKTFSFWAKSGDFAVKAKIGFGLIDDNKPFPDTGKKSVEVALTTEWQKFTLKTKKLDLSCIRSGLVIFSSGNGFDAHDIYIDEVVFE